MWRGPMAHAPTLSEVAAAAGVSPATASRVLSGSVRVATSTRQRVTDAVTKLGYIRRRASYSPPTPRSSRLVGAAVCEPFPRAVSDPFHIRLLTTTEELLTERGISLVIVPSPDTNTVRRLLTGVFGGVLVIGAADDHPVAVALASSGVPVRCTGRPPDGIRLPYVDVDNGDGGRQVAEHLIVGGRRRIGMIAGPRTFPAAQDRLAGFRKTLELAGVANVPVARGDFSFASGVHGMRWLLDRAPKLDAVFAAADAMAAGAMRTLHKSGRRVPEDVAIVGFDDAPFARRTRPPLTTVRQPVEELAIRAATLLLDDMGGNAEPAANDTLPTELVVRESSP